MSPEEQRAKHLDYIQNIITRLAHNSFVVKGWSIALASAAYGFAVEQAQWLFAFGGSIGVMVFWLLDAYYLHIEKMYRRLYAEAIKEQSPIPLYSLDYTTVEASRWGSIVKSAWTLTQAGLHVPIAIGGLVLTFVLYCGYSL